MKYIRFVFSIIFLFFSVMPAYAQGGILLPAGLKIDRLDTLISALFGLALIIGGLLCFLNIILGGMQWIVSGGEEKALKSAQGRIINAIVGLVILASSWAIMLVVQEFLGFTIISKPINLPLPFNFQD